MPTSRKEIALAFLRAVFAGNAREAQQKYLATGFRHHNAFFPADPESLLRGMEENAAKFPNKTMDVKRALEDGDFVAVHSHVRMNPGDHGVAVVHLFKFQADRIAEFWDVIQPVPDNLPNANGMF